MEFLLDPHIWAGLITLIILEIVLGIDNIVFIAILADKLPPHQRDKARVLGLSLALLMRLGLLFTIAWLVTLTKPLITVLGWTFSGRDLILLFGGLFLLYKAVTELHERMEGQSEVQVTTNVVYASFIAVVTQIVILDAVFSLDSVITAIGMIDNIYVMMVAMIIAMFVMLLASKPLTTFVNRHPTVIILCLSFLLLIGISLIAEGFGFHIPKGYIYAGIGIAILIEAFNQVAQHNTRKHESKIPLRHRTADSILRLMGGKSETVANSIQHAEAQEAFGDQERYMIGGVLTLAERSVATIMTPRREISWININETTDKIREQILSVPHSLFPICRGSLDEVLSVLHAKDILKLLDDEDKLQALLKQHRPIFIFEKMKVIDAIKTLRTAKGSLVLVNDEYGNIQGLVSPHDVFEAIAGEFPDADEQLDLIQIDETTWKASGALDLYQLELVSGVNLVEENAGYISVAGLILDKLRGEVEVGSTLDYQRVNFKVTEIEDNIIKTVIITPSQSNL